MTKPEDFSDEDINQAWQLIEEDLSDIAPPETLEPSPTHSPTDSFTHTTPPDYSAENPRNWKGPDDDVIEELLAEEDDISYREVTDKDLIVEHPYKAFAWFSAIVLILLGIGISTSFLPGSASFGIVLLAMGFGLGALAAFWTARRPEEENPFDDGTRV